MEKVKRRRKSGFRVPTLTADGAALGIFILLVIAAPLAFGGVDRIVQIGLLLLLALGVCIFPPAVARPGRLGNGLIVAVVAVLLLKEFGPASVFGSTVWRKTLTESYGLVFPWTHNPEPSRALDGLLAGVVAIVWFLWVRMIAINREHRNVMLWGMLVSAAIVSIVSFSTRGIDPQAIYGLRYTPGWVGFGPFPNRNHTACFLAMGMVLGAGCVCWAGSRKKFPLMGGAIVLCFIAFAGLLATQSRGGVVVAFLGLILFLIMVLFRFPSVRAFSIAAGAVLMLGAVGLAFGAQVIGRFVSKESGDVSNMMRVHIWQDSLRVWKDAPLFGHGLGSFTQIFPIYQEVATGESIVLHPESSWLQWLVELGVLLVLFAAIALVAYVVPRVRVAYSANRSIFMRAGPFAAAAVLVIHSIFDVPAHRWATAGFALAALAIACAPSGATGLLPSTRKAGLVPLGIALFWALPLICDWPAWSPLSLTRLLAREQTTPFVSVSELERALGYFPLDPTLHYSIAMHQIDDPLGRRTAQWQQHFRVAARLMPGSWEMAAMQARACARVSPGISLHYWQVAVERGGHRAEEVFALGMEETVRVPGAAVAWEQYAHNHPDMLLTFARNVREPASRLAYEQWWTGRGSLSKDIGDREVDASYKLVPRFGTQEQFDQFRDLHPDLRTRDFKSWVSLLHGWKADDAAWEILNGEWPDAPSRPTTARGDQSHLATRWRVDPRDVVNAREYVEYLLASGDAEGAAEVILTVARRPSIPEWFVRKAVHHLAKGGKVSEAVSLFLGEEKLPGTGI